MENKEKVLAASVLCKGLSEMLLQQVAAIAQERHFRRGEVIFLEGNTSSGFYMVVAGQVKVFKMALDGREQILYVLGPGEPFGIVPVFHGQHFPASAISLGDSTAFFFPKQEFIALITAHPDLALAIIAALARRLRRFADKIESLSLKEVPARLASHLLYLARIQARMDQVTLDIPKKQLANLLGTSAETLSRIFAEMSAAGLIQVKGRKIELLNPEELKNKAKR
ncbi:Crp/Fnr family transcriptional regulator [Candidatus Electronema sp. PJ]|uniref:Crp/Fnr family transcriptional regulator n=1 Tax=Candidatus Electronema sp. PJ TaxID=3401572 RepID=UPI003AA91232